MSSVILFFITCAFATGVTTWVLAFSLFFRKKSALEKSFLLTLSFFMFILLVSTLLFYIQSVLAKTGPVYFILLFLTRLGAAGLIISLTDFIHRLVGFAQSKRGRIVFATTAGILTAVFLVLFIVSYRMGMYFTQEIRAFDLSDLVIYAVVPYPIVLFAVRYRAIENDLLRRLTRSFIILTAVFVPTIVIDDFNPKLDLQIGPFSTVHVQILFFPFLYIAINILLLFYGFRHFIRSRRVPSSGSPVSDDFVSRFGITARERELLSLLVEGYSNKEIGEKLFISPATVRNHLHHIFEKTGVTSRLELVRLCSE